MELRIARSFRRDGPNDFLVRGRTSIKHLDLGMWSYDTHDPALFGVTIFVGIALVNGEGSRMRRMAAANKMDATPAPISPRLFIPISTHVLHESNRKLRAAQGLAEAPTTLQRYNA